MGAGLLTTGLQSCCLVISLSRGLTPSSAFVDEAARLRGITRRFVQGVVEIRSFKLRPWRSYSPRFRLGEPLQLGEASPSGGGQGARRGESIRRRTGSVRSKRRAFGYRLSDYEQELELIGG